VRFESIVSDGMTDWKPRYVIVGAGAIGSTVAVLLARAGARVICVARPAFADALRRAVVIRLDGQNLTAPVDAVTGIEEIDPGQQDILILATKSQDTENVVRLLSEAYDRSTPLVSLQNGVRNEEFAARSFECIYAGLVFFSATQLSPSEIFVPPGRSVAIGLYPAGVDDRAHHMADDLSGAGFEAISSPYVMAMKYGKLIANLNNATHAITGLWLELGAADEDMRRLMLAVREEGLKVLERAGIAVEPPVGVASPIRILGMTEKLRKPARPGARAEAEKLPVEDRTYASMSQDLHFGRASNEAEFLNGEIVRLGRSIGVPTPYNEALLEIVEKMFKDGTKPGIYTPAQLQALVEERSKSGS
jgi:2-dehydropantoate 2-reductase